MPTQQKNPQLSLTDTTYVFPAHPIFPVGWGSGLTGFLLAPARGDMVWSDSDGRRGEGGDQAQLLVLSSQDTITSLMFVRSLVKVSHKARIDVHGSGSTILS